MTTPNKNAILERATELWRRDRIRNGQPYENTPEEEELKEEGFLLAAQQELMRSESTEYKAFIEKEYNECVLGKPTQQGSENTCNKNMIKTLNTIEQIPFSQNEAMASGFFISGTRQCGKSTLAMQLADRLIQKGIIIYVLDPTMVWMTRRKAMKVLSIPEPTEHLINLPWTFQNTIFDLSTLHTQHQQQFSELFSQTMMNVLIDMEPQQRPQTLVIFEEAHTPIPNFVFNSKRLMETKRLITQGANFGISFGAITQFAAMVDKLPVKASQQRYFGLTSEPNDLRYIGNFIGKQQAEQLRNLDVGEFVYNYKTVIKRFTVPYSRNLYLNETPQTVFNYTYMGA